MCIHFTWIDIILERQLSMILITSYETTVYWKLMFSHSKCTFILQLPDEEEILDTPPSSGKSASESESDWTQQLMAWICDILTLYKNIFTIHEKYWCFITFLASRMYYVYKEGPVLCWRLNNFSLHKCVHVIKKQILFNVRKLYSTNSA